MRNPVVHGALVYRRAAVLLALCLTLALVASSSAVHAALLEALRATEVIIDAHVVAGALAFVLIAAASAMLAFVSIAVVIPAAVFAWGAPLSIALLWSGWVLGGIASFTIGKYCGQPVLRWLAAQDALDKLQARLPVAAPLWMIVLLQLALPSEIPGYVLGLLRYPFARYTLALALAELPYALATVYLGASFVDGRSGVILGTGVALALLSVASLLLFRKALGPRPAVDGAMPVQQLHATASTGGPVSDRELAAAAATSSSAHADRRDAGTS